MSDPPPPPRLPASDLLLSVAKMCKADEYKLFTQPVTMRLVDWNNSTCVARSFTTHNPKSSKSHSGRPSGPSRTLGCTTVI